MQLTSPSPCLSSCSFILLSVEVTGGLEEEEAARRLHAQPLPWFGSADPGGTQVLLPPAGTGQL